MAGGRPNVSKYKRKAPLTNAQLMKRKTKNRLQKARRKIGGSKIGQRGDQTS